MTSANIEIFKGDDKRLNLTFKDSANAAVDITGYKIYFTLKERDSDADNVAALQVSNSSHDNAVGGLSHITLTHTQTASLNPGNYVYDIQTKDASGNITTLIKGSFIVNQDVTITTA